jgi:hypothetical protein
MWANEAAFFFFKNIYLFIFLSQFYDVAKVVMILKNV